jgi:hypothetical protein
MGLAKDHCCYCKRPVIALVSVSGTSHRASLFHSHNTLLLITLDCVCFAVKPTWQPSAPPSISISPTHSLSPSSSICTDTEGLYNLQGYDCSWYEAADVPGCPQYGDLYSEYTSTGVAKDNCCYCKNDVVNTVVSES